MKKGDEVLYYHSNEGLVECKKRTATAELRLLARQFKAIAIVGPGQSGKTT